MPRRTTPRPPEEARAIVRALRKRYITPEAEAAAKAAFEKLGVWDPISAHVAAAENVRAALALVARGEAPLGIVYETDAKIEPKVKIIGTFPAESHAPIIYPVAATVNAKPEAATYLNFLRGNTAKAVFEQYGFTFLIRPVS